MKPCPTCGRPVETCDRCGGSLTGSRWASALTPDGHHHYHAGCLAIAASHPDPTTETALFADWEKTR